MKAYMRRRIRFIAIIVVALCFTTQPGYAFLRAMYCWNHNADDVEGQVGHKLYVAPPETYCEPPGHFDWTARSEIISGVLPPGLTLNENLSITGIPTERGHWVVKLKLSNIQGPCGDPHAPLPEMPCELDFHITGTGKVIE